MNLIRVVAFEAILIELDTQRCVYKNVRSRFTDIKTVSSFRGTSNFELHFKRRTNNFDISPSSLSLEVGFKLELRQRDTKSHYSLSLFKEMTTIQMNHQFLTKTIPSRSFNSLPDRVQSPEPIKTHLRTSYFVQNLNQCELF